MNTQLTSASVLELAPTGEQHQYAHRRFPRHRTYLPLKVRNQREFEIGGTCIVIAVGGIKAVLSEVIPVGSVVRLRLALPNHSMLIEVLAIVRCQADRHHGFEFLSHTDAERLSIIEFCNEVAINASRQLLH